MFKMLYKVILINVVSIVFSFDCPEGFVLLDDACYFKTHLDVLQDFVDINESLNNMEPHEIGTQAWKEGKLTYLYLGDHLLTTLPDSISLLLDVSYLDLRNNNLHSLPNEICNLYPHQMDMNLKHNKICPPYPHCFTYIGNQNIESCEFFECPEGYMKIEDECYNEKHIKALDAFIIENESLQGLSVLEIGSEIGYQGWENGDLKVLNLMNNDLSSVPEEFCNIKDDLKLFDFGENSICPPYPSCIDYLNYQYIGNCEASPIKETFTNEMMDNHEILSQLNNMNSTFNMGNFYHDVSVLQDIIDANISLKGKNPLEIGRQQWTEMRLVSLNLADRGLTKLPESLCNIYENLNTFDISNNFIEGEYPTCMQERSNRATACRDGYNLFDEQCYYYADMSVLIDFIKLNPSLEKFHPLMLGYQIWEKNRLELLYLVGMGITRIPDSISNLNALKYLDLNSNDLVDLPHSMCSLYPQLISMDLTNNKFSPPYLPCVDYMGQQNVINEYGDECPMGYIPIFDSCYFKDDLDVLKKIIDENKSLEGKYPLEIGIQKWKNMRLDILYLGENELTNFPESVCEIYDNLSSINIGKNKICPPYPSCMEGNVNDQDTTGCP